MIIPQALEHGYGVVVESALLVLVAKAVVQVVFGLALDELH